MPSNNSLSRGSRFLLSITDLLPEYLSAYNNWLRKDIITENYICVIKPKLIVMFTTITPMKISTEAT